MIVILLAYVASVVAQDPEPPIDIPRGGPPPKDDNRLDMSEDEEESLLMKEWEMYMTDFSPADLITFEISGRDTEEFFEDITTIPSFVRGAWFVASSETEDIDLTIFDPLKNVVV